MIDGIIFITEKKLRSSWQKRPDIFGCIKKREDGAFYFYCSITNECSDSFIDETKNRGLLPGIKDGVCYLVFTKNGYSLTNNGRGSKRKCFSCVLRETPVNKLFLEKNSGKYFSGIKIDSETIMLNFKEGDL